MPVKNIDITVDLTRPGVVNTQKELRYGDENNLRIAVTDGGNQVTLSSLGITTVDLVVSRLTGTPIDVVGSIVDDKAVFTLDGASLSVPGYTKATVQFYGADGSRVSTADFSFKSLADPSMNAVGDSTEQTIIQQVLVNGPEVIDEAEQKIVEMDNAVATTQVVWKGTLEDDAALTAISGMENGWTYRIKSSATNNGLSRTVRYDGTDWVTTDLQDPNALNQISAQLDDTMRQLDGLNRVLTQSDFNTKKLKLYGSFIIDTPINLSNITISGLATITQLSTFYINDNVKVDTGITFDLNDSYGESLFLQGNNISILKNTFKNAYSTTFSRFIYIKDICENITISQNVFSGISALPNGINGDSNGTVRAIQAQNAKNLIIEDNIFEGIEGLEDSDYIAILSNGTKIIDGVTYFNHGDIKIRNNTFKNPQKSVVKIQCSGVEVANNFVESDGSVFTRTLFRAYDCIDIKINNNYTNENIKIENALQLEDILNGQFNDNKFYINKQEEWSGTLFFVMDVRSKNISIENNEILGGNETNTLYSKFDGSQKIKFIGNVLDTHTFELRNVNNLIIKLNTTLNAMFAFIEFPLGTLSSNIRIELNVLKEVSRLINIRNSGNSEIQLTDNTILNQPSGFLPFTFFDATQDKQQFKVIDKTTKFLSYGITADRPNIYKYIGYPYFDTTLNKLIIWNGSQWRDGAGVSV